MSTLKVDSLRFFASVDWITATREMGKSHSGDQLFTGSLFNYLRSLPIVDGAEKWSFMGYYGWTQGTACWGNNGTRALIRAWGQASAMGWRTAAKYSSNVSRLDLAFTFWPTNRGSDLAQLAAEAVLDEREAGRIHAKKKLALINGFGHGDTLYIGSRKSQVFARLYDKGKQSGNAAMQGAWRAELELKDEKANATAHALLYAPNEFVAVKAMVCTFFDMHGIRLAPVGEEQLELPRVYQERDRRIESLLSWLGRDVRPAVVRAVKAVGEDEVVAILGLAPGRNK